MLFNVKIHTERYGKIINDQHNYKLYAIFFSHFHFEIKFDGWHLKRKKHIKKLAEKKRNKHVQVVETNINVEDNEESLWKNVRKF